MITNASNNVGRPAPYEIRRIPPPRGVALLPRKSRMDARPGRLRCIYLGHARRDEIARRFASTPEERAEGGGGGRFTATRHLIGNVCAINLQLAKQLLGVFRKTRTSGAHFRSFPRRIILFTVLFLIFPSRTRRPDSRSPGF